MKTRIAYFAAAVVLIVVSAAGLLSAQTFEQSVTDALNKDGALGAQMSTLKQCIDDNSAKTSEINAAAEQGYQELSVERGGGGGGFHGGGNYHPPVHPPMPPYHPPMPHPPIPHPMPPHPHPQPDPHHGHDWHQWHNHPGWGNHPGHDWHWGWDPYNRPMWWVWGTLPIWYNGMSLSCYEYYNGYLNNCYAACTDGNAGCVADCDGSYECVSQCNENTGYCNDRCQVDFEQREHDICNIWP